MKVENVVKPPQKPAISRSLSGSLTGSTREKRPMKKHPRMFAIKVPIGWFVLHHVANAQRHTPPKPEPTNTAITL